MSPYYTHIIQMFLAAFEYSSFIRSHIIEIHAIHLKNLQQALHVQLIISLVFPTLRIAHTFSTTEAFAHTTDPRRIITFP